MAGGSIIKLAWLVACLLDTNEGIVFTENARAVFPRYDGNVSVTNGGRICQKWAEQIPHVHKYNTSEFFPNDSSIEEAVNYCRQPHDLDYPFPWCYTTDRYKRWQNCDKRISRDGSACGGVQTTTSGWLTSVDSDGDGWYDGFRDCLWTLVAMEDKQIHLQVISMDVQHHVACLHAFLEMYEETFTHGRYCGDSTPTIRSRSHILYVRFRVHFPAEGDGFTANYSHIEPQLNDVLNGSAADPAGSKEIPIDTEYGKLKCPRGVDITLYTGNVSVTNGGRICQDWARQTPNYHDWTEELLYSVDGSMKKAKNFCRNLNDNPMPFCVPADLRAPFEYCYEQICSADGPECGGVVTNDSGTLTSIDRDGDGIYDSERDCLWTVKARENNIILVNVTFMDIVERYRCSADSLEIYEGDFSHGLFCGNSTPTVWSHSNVLSIRFKSDYSESGKGFILEYSQHAADSFPVYLKRHSTLGDIFLTEESPGFTDQTQTESGYEVDHGSFVVASVVAVVTYPVVIEIC